MTVVRGFCMGAADIVPGVSGGTIAFIFGIYQRLIDNIRTGARVIGALLRLRLGEALGQLRRIEWSFLVPLLGGIAAAFLALSHLIENLLRDHPEPMAGLFLGLVVASVAVAWKMVHEWTRVDLTIVLVVGALAFVLLGFQSGTVADPSAAQFLGAGAIAICAMILPGISGSFLLLMLGMYAALLGAVNDRALGDLSLFLVGAVVGLAAFSTLLSWLLEHHSDRVLAALIGLMIGSVRVLWPWPNGVGIISDVQEEVVKGTGLGLPSDGADLLWPTVLGGAAFFVVIALSTFGERRAAARAASAVVA